MKRRSMDLAIFWLPIIGSILLGGLAGTVWYGGNKTFGLWLAFAGLICLGLVVVLQIQQAIWASHASEPAATTATPKQMNLSDNTI